MGQLIPIMLYVMRSGKVRQISHRAIAEIGKIILKLLSFSLFFSNFDKM